MIKDANIIIAHYPAGSGGKFLLNCVGLSEHAVLQSSLLASKQLNKQLTSADKLNLLLSRLEAGSHIWDDLGLGCQQLFGINNNLYQQVGNVAEHFDPVIGSVIESGLYLTLVSQHIKTLLAQQQVWQEAKVIALVNANIFMQKYRPNKVAPNMLTQFWNAVRDESWPGSPPTTIDEYKNLDPSIRHEIETVHNGMTDLIKFNVAEQEILASEQTFIWDCNWFLDGTKTVDNVGRLYNFLDFTDFNADAISTFYTGWISQIPKRKVP